MVMVWPFNCILLVMIWRLGVVYLLHLLKPEVNRLSMCWELVGPGTKYKSRPQNTLNPKPLAELKASRSYFVPTTARALISL